ncbi:hypothetical protein ACOI1H_25390, partial [Loktanella sp. DJP18]|uniref:hypothetical protein n=1 Tax=Loktanella sp. DJP18 TaxID=3409788 RepID=UPI003BB51306
GHCNHDIKRQGATGSDSIDEGKLGIAVKSAAVGKRPKTNLTSTRGERQLRALFGLVMKLDGDG